MQSALKSFFVRHQGGQFDLAGWDSLWVDARHHHPAQVRAPGRVLPRRLPRRAARTDAGAALSDDSAPAWEAIAEEPTPSQAALLAEAVEQVMHSLGDDRERRILELGLQGYKPVEISTEVGRSEAAPCSASSTACAAVSQSHVAMNDCLVQEQGSC